MPFEWNNTALDKPTSSISEISEMDLRILVFLD